MQTNEFWIIQEQLGLRAPVEKNKDAKTSKCQKRHYLYYNPIETLLEKLGININKYNN